MKHPIPEAALSQNIAVLGKNGSGKTYAAKGSIVERLLEDGRRVGIVDPTGAWWGLRTSRDGKGAGFPILVLGGDHGDLPLPALGGAAVARLLAVQGVNLVADTSQLTVGERTRWFTDFAGALYRENRTPLHLVIDEAHNFAPQGKVPDPDAGKMLHAASTLASQGRSRGIRLTMITQRPQKLHKDSLTSADTLIAMRVIHPLDRGAVADWINGCGDPAKGKEVLDSLANLQRGEGWAWYPEGGFLQRMKFPAIATFDSSATPMDGAPVAQPKGAAEIDLTEIKAALADAVKEAEANDPKFLRKANADLREKYADLEGTLAKVRMVSNEDDLARERQRGKIDGYAAAIAALVPMMDRMQTLRTALDEQIGGLLDDLAGWRVRFADASVEAEKTHHVVTRQESSRAQAGTPAPIAPRSVAKSDVNGAMPKAERAMLTAVAQRHPRAASRIQIAILSGYSIRSSAFGITLGSLRSKGLIAGQGDENHITREGLSALGPIDPAPTGRAVVDMWRGRLGQQECAFFDMIVAAYPRAVTKDELAARSGYSITSSSFGIAVGKLRALELIGRAELKASDALFD